MLRRTVETDAEVGKLMTLRHRFIVPFQGEKDSVAGLSLGIFPRLATTHDVKAWHDKAPIV